MTYLTEDENLSTLVNQIPPHDAPLFAGMGASRIEAAFAGRFLIVFKPTGLNADCSHRAPEILTTLKFSEFYCDDERGAEAVITDLRMGESMTIDHVPARVFDYELFIQIPAIYRMRWDARRTQDGVVRSLVFPIALWTKNRSSYYSAGVTYAETPNRFRTMYPGVNAPLYFD